MRIRVVWTNRGRHREYAFAEVTLDGEGRFVASNDQAEVSSTVTTVDGQLRLPGTFVLPSLSPRSSLVSRRSSPR
jgi:hypothetical protein